MEVMSVADVQQLYRQWQDGKLLDNEERSALHAPLSRDRQDCSFAELLKSVTELDA